MSEKRITMELAKARYRVELVNKEIFDLMFDHVSGNNGDTFKESSEYTIKMIENRYKILENLHIQIVNLQERAQCKTLKWFETLSLRDRASVLLDLVIACTYEDVFDVDVEVLERVQLLVEDSYNDDVPTKEYITDYNDVIKVLLNTLEIGIGQPGSEDAVREENWDSGLTLADIVVRVPFIMDINMKQSYNF